MSKRRLEDLLRELEADPENPALYFAVGNMLMRSGKPLAFYKVSMPSFYDGDIYDTRLFFSEREAVEFLLTDEEYPYDYLAILGDGLDDLRDRFQGQDRLVGWVDDARENFAKGNLLDTYKLYMKLESDPQLPEVEKLVVQ